jgi:preprotein translocase subunit SecG
MSGLASVVLIAHIFIAVALTGVVLLQRSEGGALGIGGGAGSFMSARGAGSALTRATMILAAMFFSTSLILTVLSRSPTHELDLQSQPANGKVQAPQPAGSAPVSAPQSGAPLPSDAAPGLTTPAPAPATGTAPATAPAAPARPATPPKP